MTITTHMLGDKRVGQFVDNQILDTAASVQEALDKGYVVGKKEMLVSQSSGVVRSMVAGVSKDGNGRKIDEIVSVQPSLRCKLTDSCEPVTKDNVEAKVRVRVLKEGKVDATGWTFNIEGATGSMVINSVTTGEVMGEVVIGEAIDFNGEDLNLPESATIAWTAIGGTTEKTGTIAAAKRTCAYSRITTAADVLSSLTGSEWENKVIEFKITNGSKVAIKYATLRVAA